MDNYRMLMLFIKKIVEIQMGTRRRRELTCLFHSLHIVKQTLNCEFLRQWHLFTYSVSLCFFFFLSRRPTTPPYNLTLLENVNLDSNSFTSIPPNFFRGIINLRSFSINFNTALSHWNMPEILSENTNLQDFQASDANVKGTIPDIFHHLPNFMILGLSNNNLTGSLPPSLAGTKINSLLLDNQIHKLSGKLDILSSMTHLVNIFLFSNSFTGSIPDLYCLNLSFLDLHNNQLTGLVPQSVMSLPNLFSVNLLNNKLQGPLPVFQHSEYVGVGNVSNSYFSGSISPAIAKLTSLMIIKLNDNHLVGNIPKELASLPNLQILDVSNNNLSTHIPEFPKRVRLIYGVRHQENATGVSTGLIAGLTCGIRVGVIVLVLIILFVVKKRTEKDNVEDHNLEQGNNMEMAVFHNNNVAYSVQLLRQVTGNFGEDKILGKGGFAVVYGGELEDGAKIAVKRMQPDAVGNKGQKEFEAEIEVLSKVRHRHVVSLLGYCTDEGERLLVYECMPQGTLSQHLFKWKSNNGNPLNWKQRVSIALDVGRGVEYLHSLANIVYVHRDLKSSNILLGNDMRAKVADFGLVKSVLDVNHSFSATENPAGTFGYLSPEYAGSGKVSTKLDVYAFGVVLMELVSGRQALDKRLPADNHHIVSWFRRVTVSKDNIQEILDETLITDDEEILDSICKVVELAGQCTEFEPNDKPNMSWVVNALGPLVERWQPSLQESGDNSWSNISLGSCSNMSEKCILQSH